MHPFSILWAIGILMFECVIRWKVWWEIIYGGSNQKGHVPRLNGTSSFYMYVKWGLGMGSLTQKLKSRLYWPNCLFVTFHHEMNLGKICCKGEPPWLNFKVKHVLPCWTRFYLLFSIVKPRKIGFFFWNSLMGAWRNVRNNLVKAKPTILDEILCQPF